MTTDLRTAPSIQSLVGFPVWLLDVGVVFGSGLCVLASLLLVAHASWYGTGVLGLAGPWVETQGIYLGGKRLPQGKGPPESAPDCVHYFAYTVDGRSYEDVCYGRHDYFKPYAPHPSYEQEPVAVLYCQQDPSQGCIVGLRVAKELVLLFLTVIVGLFGAIVLVGSAARNVWRWKRAKDLQFTVAKWVGVKPLPPSKYHRRITYSHQYRYSAAEYVYSTEEKTTNAHPRQLRRLMVFDPYQPHSGTLLSRAADLRRKIRYSPDHGIDAYRTRFWIFVGLLLLQLFVLGLAWLPLLW